MWFVSPKTAVTCPDPPRRPDLNFDKTSRDVCVKTTQLFDSVHILGENMHAACNCKTQTTLYYGKSFRIGWYLIAFHYREGFQGLVANQAIIFFFASCYYILSPLQDYKYNLCKGKVIPLQARCGPEGG